MSEAPKRRKDRPVVIVSSTARDLPEHRKEVEDACLRQGMFPVMMERLPASDAEAISASLAMVDEADIYVGVFAHRYGYVPKEGNPQQISVTQMEYERAVERKIPRLIFVIDKKRPLGDFTIDDIDKGESAEKLAQFKTRVETENIVNFFKSPVDLRANVINSLSQLRKPDLSTFHYVSDIRAPPESFIAHPYTLLQTHRLVGRQPELNLLTDWVARPNSDVYRARILNVVAVGGMGKSALTWKWFNDIAPQEMKPLAGRMWWSFYESDATFENFVTRALAYVTRRPLDEVQQTPAPERESQLLAALDREPFLLVLDGLERILIAYARMDAAILEDSEVGNRRNLREIAAPRAGRFIKKLTHVKRSRILVSTRLHPAELETDGGDSTVGSFRLDITGLADEDAVELWHTLKVAGSRDLLLPIFATFGKHPLLIQSLVGEVRRYRRAPGDFEEWRRANPRFDPTQSPLLRNAMGHVLEFSLRGLDDRARRTLHVIAAFRMPARYDSLAALLVGEGKACAGERELDEVLTELEDRGLVGWNKRANRYDLHPIVRGIVWDGVDIDARRGVYTNLHAHFKALPRIDDYREVKSLEDLTPAVELYNTLIGLGRYDDAYVLFYERLNKPTLFRLSASRTRVELLRLLFANESDEVPHLRSSRDQAFTLNALALGYQFSGRPGCAIQWFRRQIKILSARKDNKSLSIGFRNLSDVLRLSGALYESESTVRRALVITRKQGNRFNEAVCLSWLGQTLMARGKVKDSGVALQRSLRIFTAQSHDQFAGLANSFLAQRALWLGEFTDALSLANRAWELARVQNHEADFIYAARAQGAAALGLNEAAAAERLHHALTRAHTVNHVEEELPALVALAELRRRQGELVAARELLEDVWEAAERGPYPLVHADAWNVLAEVERDEGNREAAVEAASKAYRLAWCDGPPFAYHWGLEKARGLLRELGAGESELPAFDESKFEAMPEVEIDPADEFGAGSVGESEE